MDPLTLLRADHESVLGLLETMQTGHRPGANSGDERRRHAMKLVIAESQHEAVEEEIFWPAVREAVTDGDRLADTAIAQEEQGKKLLQQLENCEAGSAEFEKTFAEFARAAREHIEFEEQEVWPAFRSAVTAEQMEDLGRRLAAAKKMAPTRPHPHTPSSGAVQGTMGKAAAVVDHVRDKLSGRADEAPSQAPPA